MCHLCWGVATRAVKTDNEIDSLRLIMDTKFSERSGSDEKIEHPAHYTQGRQFEPWDVIEDWGLSYHLATVVKYISRAGRKDDLLQDLRKAQAHLNREITRLERVEKEKS